ncbi:MAG: monofunctional biosynthetic peptidoglycan transglycosylase [Bacteroidaceae bacterium]|nr:monofunctional biosynthetic peptidoglycan transglycosylase [Bacteroidaceae bacterium]
MARNKSGLKLLKKLQRLCQWLFVGFFVSSLFAVLLFRWVPVPITPLMLIRCAQQAGRGEQLRLRHHWVRLSEMSPNMPIAVMASEDQRFLEHHGFDTQAIKDAVAERMNGGRRRGGSTISQQTAKNVFLWPASSWLRKGLEAYFTCLIEVFWSKERIMEVYLNSIEMGDGIYGAEAVAQWHFGCTSAQLSKANCALIAATLPNPLRFSSKTPSGYMLKRQTWIMRQMRYIKWDE